jgi:N6-L-threonylcarbamoyladenine synthase
MIVLGIESSCDECAAALVDCGRILSSVVATQIPVHRRWQGVVPEIASRMHAEWIDGVAAQALDRAGLRPADVEGVAAVSHPGLLGSLLVGLHFAKAFAWARNIPFIAVDHLLAHLYASRLVFENREGGPLSGPLPYGGENSFPAPLHLTTCKWSGYPPDNPPYPFLGLLVSGGHSVICRAGNFDDITVLGTTIDDAAGEAFDKVAKFYGFGYPGGAAIEALARSGDSSAFKFPMPSLYKTGRGGETNHRYDVSYSGLKTAVINQLEQFRVKARPGDPAEEAANIAASFQKTAVEILLRGLFRAVEDTGITTVVAGGGVAANSCLRSRLAENKQLTVFFPPPELCGDNGAMAAGLGERYLLRGDRSLLNVTASARVKAFRKHYP